MAEASESPRSPESLGNVALKYTGLRLAAFALPFALAAAVLVPLNGSDGWFEAALVGIISSIPLAIWWGRGLRVRLSLLVLESRSATKARVDDTAARVKAVEDARKAAEGQPGS
jgi:hypothetical protein